MNKDELRKVLFDIASSHPALTPDSRNRIHEPRLCPSCHDVYTEDGVPCEECAQVKS